MEHTLVDETRAWAIDPMRAYYLVDRIIAALARLGTHSALVPANVIIDAADAVRLVDTAPPAAPYTAPDRALSERSNVYSLGIILDEMVGGRADAMRSTIDTAIGPHATRPSLATLRERLRATGWESAVVAPWHRAFVPPPTERALIAALADDGGCDVYADWLEQNGHDHRARFVRAETHEHATATEPRWRAVISNPRLSNCHAQDCPQHWRGLATTDVDNVRECRQCQRLVKYCTSLAEVQNEGSRLHPVAPDAALVASEVARTLAMLHMRYGTPANPPPPRSYMEGAPPREGNVLRRLLGLFRRR